MRYSAATLEATRGRRTRERRPSATGASLGRSVSRSKSPGHGARGEQKREEMLVLFDHRLVVGEPLMQVGGDPAFATRNESRDTAAETTE